MLNRITLQRLKQLPKIPSVWEGARQHISGLVAGSLDTFQDAEGENDCILWIDGTQGAVRAMSTVPSDSGQEPLVRTLLQAMENPQGAGDPARPQKIVVRDREAQFYLRGVLQDLDIVVDYVPLLPLIDELFETLQRGAIDAPPQLPKQYADALHEKALDIWDVAPWNILNEQQILAVEVKAWEIETLYVSVLGMAGVEYGLLMYRSLDSLKQFRQRVLQEDHSPKRMQEAFLEQDCLYLNYELLEPVDAPHTMQSLFPVLASAPASIQPDFGSIHPLEGLRTSLADEEGATLLVVLEALKRFFQKYYPKLEDSSFPALEGRYRIPHPEPECDRKSLPIRVATLPEVADELMQQTNEAFNQQMGTLAFPILRDDYVPEGSIILLTEIPADWVSWLHQSPQVYCQPPADASVSTDKGLPVVLIQTSKPKAQQLIQQLQQAQGVKAVCFNPGRDPISGESFELGLLQTGDQEFHLFAEYQSSSLIDARTLKRWQTWQKDYQGACGVVIASGVTGVARGKPRLKDMLALFETAALSPKEINLPPLQLHYAMDWELD